jgi:hypothetical protein
MAWRRIQTVEAYVNRRYSSLLAWPRNQASVRYDFRLRSGTGKIEIYRLRFGADQS